MEDDEASSKSSIAASKRALPETFVKKRFEGVITIQVCETKIGSIIRHEQQL
jgi:hypothetical protein